MMFHNTPHGIKPSRRRLNGHGFKADRLRPAERDHKRFAANGFQIFSVKLFNIERRSAELRLLPVASPSPPWRLIN
jgi:hypothetical protein